MDDVKIKEALDALAFVCRTLGWLEVVPPYGDAVSRTAECDRAINECAKIRAALQSKQSVNQEMLEALNFMAKALIAQANLALSVGGYDAVSDFNGEAFEKFNAVIAKAEGKV